MGEVTSQVVSFGSYSATTLYAYDSNGQTYCEVEPDAVAEFDTTCPSAPPVAPTPGDDPVPHATLTSYNSDGEVSEVTNPLGGITQYGYDEAGNQSCEVAPIESAAGVVCPAADDAYEADPGATITEYDSAGRSTELTNPLGGVTNTTYFPSGEVATSTVEGDGGSGDPSVETSYTYNADGQVASTTVGSSTTQEAYDPNGNVYCSVSADAVAAGSSHWQCPAWQASWIASPPAFYGLYSSDSSPSQAEDVTTSFYNADGEEVEGADAGGYATVSLYDADGRVTCALSAGEVSTYLGGHHGATYPYTCPDPPLTSPPAAGSEPGYTTSIYDPAGNLVSSTDADGNTTTYSYEDGQQVSETSPAGETTTSCYYFEDSNGECAASAPSAGGTGEDEYSETEPPSSSDSSGITTTYTYTPGGQTYVTTTSSGETTDTYDGLGDLLSVQSDSVGSSYTSIADSSGNDVSYTYNVDGTRATMTDVTGTTSYAYDAMGDLTSQGFAPVSGSPLSSTTVDYGYYPNGDRETMSYPGASSDTVTYAYNDQGQVSSEEDWLGNDTTFGYDADGNETLTQLPNDDNVCSDFDADDMMTSTTLGTPQSGSDCGAAAASISYGTPSPDDLIGSSTGGGSLSGSESYGYGLTDQVRSDSSGSYSYNSDGSLTALPDGESLNYSSSPSNEDTLTSTTIGPNTTDYDANSIGARASMAPESSAVASIGSSATYSYSSAGELTGVTGSGTLTATVSSHSDTSLFAEADGEVSAVGLNSDGQLGDGTTTTSTTAVTVDTATDTPLTDVVQVAEGTDFSVALTAAGDVYTWGDDGDGQLGNGDTTNSSFATEVPGVSGVTSIAAGSDFVIASAGDDLYAWGDDSNGQLGNGTNDTTEKSPVTVSLPAPASEVAAGSAFALALTTGGDVFAWGDDSDGQLGNAGGSEHSPTEISTSYLSSVVSIAAGSDTAIAATSDGGVYTWGNNSDGQIGNGYAGGGSGEATPYQVETGSDSYLGGAEQVAESNDTSYALASNGEIYAWGDNSHGQYGNGTTSDDYYAGLVASGASGIDAGGMSATKVTASGSIYAWGYNPDSMLGTDSSSGNVTSPAEVSGVTTTGQTVSSATYTYNGDGLRNSEDAAGEFSQFTWDTTTSVPELLSDGTNDYIYGPDGAPIEQISTATSTPSFFFSDALGSTRALTNSTGAVVATFSYSTYGSLAQESGTVSTPLLFTGGYYDSGAGLYYLEHRYYDPATAQFLSIDPEVHSTGEPFQYAGGDPVNATDPDGLSWWNPCDLGNVCHHIHNVVSGLLSQVASAFGQAVNAALPDIHAISGVVAVVASICAIVTSETVVGGLTCGTIALVASVANVATSDALYAEGRESGTTLALDAVGGGAAGAGSVFEVASAAAETASDTAQAAADAYAAEAKSARFLGKAIPTVKSSYYGAKAGIWQNVAEAFAVGSRGASAVGFGASSAAALIHSSCCSSCG